MLHSGVIFCNHLMQILVFTVFEFLQYNVPYLHCMYECRLCFVVLTACVMDDESMSYPCSTELLARPSLVGSKVYFFFFVNYQVSIWRIGHDLMRRKCPDDGTKCRSDTDLIVDKYKSDSSDCDTIVVHRWPEEINLASDEWRMSQKLCGTGVLPMTMLTYILYVLLMFQYY